jgi:hypothetical protein
MVMTNRSARKRCERREDPQRDDGGAGHAPQRRKQDVEKELDKALMDSFPSSDPPSISQPGSTEPTGDPKVKP